MKKRLLSIISLILASLMIVCAFASCSSGGEIEDESSDKSESSATESTKADDVESTEKDGNGSAESTPSEGTEKDPSDGTTDEDNQGGEETTKPTGGNEDIESPELVGPNLPIIELADTLKNNVSMYFPGSKRESVIYENMEMKLEYALSASLAQRVTSLTNKNGNSYIKDTMDVFVKMENGVTYYASDSIADATPNIYRFGYYYYQMRLEGQNFVKHAEATSSTRINHTSLISKNNIKNYKKTGGVLIVENESPAPDPHLVFSQTLNINAEKYNTLEITMKADSNTGAGVDMFYIAGAQNMFTDGQRVGFTIIPDGQFHTYRVPLYMGADYNGTLKGLRLDVGGAGAKYEISAINMLEIDNVGAPINLGLCRDFNVYSDKMHHVIQVAASEETTGIVEIGMLTKIDVNTVNAIVLEDKEGIKYTLEGVDWDSVEYVGFDIKDAGIFGYILPYDGRGGKLHVSYSEGFYVIEQTMAPANGTIKPSRTDYNKEFNIYNWVEGGNANDFYMGQRIYTDDNHTFDEFLEEAYCERNPLNEKNFKVVSESSSSAKYAGYDSLRGNYEFKLAGPQDAFNTAYYREPNKHYRVNFIIRGDKQDRQIYVLTYTSIGELECAALLDDKDVMLPVPLEVGKNFSELHGERNIYNLADATYGEVIFPMVVESGEKYEYTVLNLYQNWGKYPLKQLSWIQFYSPYYHLSTGVTETNCVLPWMFTDRVWYNTLPDHRGFSAPFWSNQPQHTSSGEHDWLRYVDADGNVVRWENTWNTIDSYGPTYADVKMDYITYDGKMKVSYTHSEMPQVDENRAFYEMRYEVLEDITIKNFVTDFQLYKVDPNDATGLYQKVGYLNTENKSVVVNANFTDTPVKYVLGNECPYFSFFDMDNHRDGNGYGNLSFLIYNSEFTIGGKKAEPNFAILNYKDTVLLTLDIEEETTLKAGDVFVINAIVLPWGSQLLDDGIIDPATNNYEYTMEVGKDENGNSILYMDKNVRDVRENTLVNPLKAIAGENCETVESVFIPKVKTTNGESAEFTLTGGFGNTAVRIYGFDRMTVPTIYEKINGEWVKYEVNSANDEKYPHKYDGYCIHYDGDKKFSYSFVTTMDGENDRTFKIVVDGEYERWGQEVNKELTRKDFLDIYVDPQEILDKCSTELVNYCLLDKFEIIRGLDPDERDTYLRIYGHGDNPEALEGYINAYKAPNEPLACGKYLVVKYRLPETNPDNIGGFEFWISTSESGPAESNRLLFTNVNNDGKWNTLIIDMSVAVGANFDPQKNFTAADDGNYYPKFFRFDFFDKKVSADTCIDIGYIGLESDFNDIVPLLWDTEVARFYVGNEEYYVDPLTGATAKLNLTLPEVLVDPSSGYTLGNLEFGAQIDNINGKGVALESGSSASYGIKCYNYFGKTIADATVTDCATVNGYNLVLGGWCAVEGGVNRYVWSADGGKTWHNASGYGTDGARPYTANSEILKVAKGRANNYNFTLASDAKNGAFQGPGGNNPKGLTVNLEAYKGKTVDVLFGIVPEAAQNTIIPMFYIGQVSVPNVQ